MHDVHPLTQVAQRLRGAALVLVMAYLVMDRSHAEELGGGFRATAEVLRGDRSLSPLTWAMLAFVGLALVWTARAERAAAQAA